jgi:hypothetical protein
MKTRYILPAVLAVLFAFAYISDPVDTPEPEVKQVIKLTTRHLPIYKYWATEDDDDSLTVSQQYLIVNRHNGIKIQTDSVPAESDYVITDGVRLRLWLAREKAMAAYRRTYQA